MLELEEYRSEFLQEVKATAENSKDGFTASFVDLAATKLFNYEVISDFNASFYTGVGKNKKKLRIDGYVFDEWDNSLSVIIADYIDSTEQITLTMTEVKSLIGKAEALISEILFNDYISKIEISFPAFDFASDLIRIYESKNLKKIKIYIVTDKIASSRIYSLENETVNGTVYEYHVWDIGRFYKIESSELAKQEIEIDFTIFDDKGLPCLEASDSSTNDYKSYLCIIPGDTLADIYDLYGSGLLEGNVRSFLSVRGKVNKAIRSTILSKEKAPLFFCLNNGISVTATKVKIIKRDTGSYLQYAKNLQIVNGGQTTASLSNARFKDKAELNGIFVQMKLTEVSYGKAQELIPEISKSANSQNKVSEADFFSNHPFHIRMEDFSRRKFASATGGAQYETHWFYERARGQYTQIQMNKTKSEINKFKLQNPKDQVVTKTDIAKVRNSWDRKPYIVSKGAQANFLYFANTIESQWLKDDTIYNEMFFTESISLYIMFKTIEKMVSKQEWYDGGYRANIVTYALSLLSQNLIDQYKKKFDLQRIWTNQKVPENLKEILSFASKKVYDEITAKDRKIENVTQWCKKEECWERIKDIKLDLKKIEELLIDIDDMREDKSQAKKDQRILNGIEAQLFVVDLGIEYWEDMLKWAEERRILSETDRQNLRVASKMSSTKMPNSVQCLKLQELRNRMINEGFKSK